MCHIKLHSPPSPSSDTSYIFIVALIFPCLFLKSKGDLQREVAQDLLCIAGIPLIQLLLTFSSAKDPDSGERLKYYLVGAAQHKSLKLFKLNSDSGQIRTRALLNYEDMREHVLTIKVRDLNHMETLFFVTISVEDANDHKPVFVQAQYEAEVNVDALPGLPLVKVLATDEDSGSNAMLKYSVAAESVNGTFYIDENSGMVHVATKLSAHKPSYELRVKVVDGGTPSFSSFTTVKVMLLMNV